eukprot:5450127-Prymnesium_polylepis.2
MAAIALVCRRWCPRPRGTVSSDGAPRRPGLLREEGGHRSARCARGGGLCMSGMGAGELCEAPCSFVHALPRTCHVAVHVVVQIWDAEKGRTLRFSKVRLADIFAVNIDVSVRPWV